MAAGIPILIALMMLGSLLWLLFARPRKTRLVSYFPSNEARSNYLQLVNEVVEPNATTSTKDQLIRSALIHRAIEAIRRTQVINEEKPSLVNLNQAGALSEEFLCSLLEAERETTSELFDIQCEAELIKEGWSKTILQESAALIKHAIATTTNAQMNTAVTGKKRA